MHDVWSSPVLVHHIYIFMGSYPLTEFCQVQNPLCIQVSQSSILSALLHGTRAVGISQTLWRGIFTRQGGHAVRHWAVELSSLYSCAAVDKISSDVACHMVRLQ